MKTLSLVLAALLAASPVAASALPSCSWNQPGHNPFLGDVVAAVDRYADIPPAQRSRLKARMARRDYDEIVSIRRDSIVGQARYGAEIRDMHFGTGQVCGQVNRAAWATDAQERGLVYCEGEHCILVPTVCRNVSRISRTSRPPGAVAGAAATGPGAAAGQGAAAGPLAQGPAAEADGGTVASSAQGLPEAASPASGPTAAPESGQPVAAVGDLSGLPSLVGDSAPAAGGAAPLGSAGAWASASGASWLGSMAGGASLGAAGWAGAAALLTDRQVSALPGNTRSRLTDGNPSPAIDTAAVISAVPEPAGVLLWLVGLAALLARARQRRNAPGRAGRVNPG